jgi:hypothetical protein
MKSMLKNDKGVAGLSILLSVVVTLFIIGLIVMVFTLMGNKMSEATYTSTTETIVNQTTGSVNETGVLLSSYRDGVCSVTNACNSTGAYNPISVGNYTVTGCLLQYDGKGVAGNLNNTVWNVTYSVVYNADNDATRTMNDTVVGLSTTTEWFPLFVVISAMVVLILLTVIIIVSIRGSGMVEGVAGGKNTVGTA